MARRTDIDIKELKEPDAFMEGIGAAVTYTRKNRMQVIGVAVSIVAVFAAGVTWRASSVRRSESTAAAFLRATDALASNNLTAADAALRNVAASGVAPYDDLASLYSAEILVRRGEVEEGRAIYEQVAAGAGTPYLRQIAIVGNAHTLEAQGQNAEALKAYAQAGAIDGPYREPALRGQLRTASATDQSEHTKHALQALLENFPDSDDADRLSQQLESLGGS